MVVVYCFLKLLFIKLFNLLIRVFRTSFLRFLVPCNYAQKMMGIGAPTKWNPRDLSLTRARPPDRRTTTTNNQGTTDALATPRRDATRGI
jgi:hypothetical protein